ncbi:hypothetical protein ISF_09262 [Cordyceps fumosorosea ARSEF 2679]|uniref:Histidine phosphatase superfamily, clade-2 n=1 Tax=Cordyceps fumosorosea (strain ARSEF 2679) TaxID=1081104 RepID=A0A167LBB2_CORFA|nr:hypothetical protein ISF_09262 [Cordyceps fumosorosea ARSEF 2679]OAA52879.1 hypothetical protein ISF_09262 [Cordyceps fumosorosea ARSEF 2679]
MTPPTSLLPLLALAVAGAAARPQEDGGSNAVTSTSGKVWAAVAFVNHGETTPFLLSSHPVLTPAGAQQLYRQGQAFRRRYLSAAAGNATTTGAAPIRGLGQNAIDNTQLRVLSQRDEWVAGGAVAFMQALYPPDRTAFNAAAGGQALAENYVAGNTTSYPLDGYQYPQIETLPSTDINSIGIQGHLSCPNWQAASTTNLTTNPTLRAAAQQSASFYTQLLSSAPLRGLLPTDDANLFNAYDIHNLVRYERAHNKTVFDALPNAEATLARLAADAFTVARAKTDPGSSTANDTASVTLTVAGRTLARLVADQLNQTAVATAVPLTLLFGSFQPLMSLFSVTGLLTRDNVLSTALGNVTAPGAAAVFELVSENSGGGTLPKPEDLSVRFVYRPTADANDTFQVFSLFGSGNGGRTIPYLAFRDKMAAIGRDAAAWCAICQPDAATATWCRSLDAASSSGRSQISPAVAGVIGALVMGALVALVVFALCALGGFRLRRRGAAGGGGGGAEKRAGDRDVRYGSEGDAQERVGSWEMRGQPEGQGRAAARAAEQQRNPFDDDAISDVDGAAPVRAREGF